MTIDVQLRQCTPGDAPALALAGQATFLETFAGILPGPAIVTHCARAHSAAHYDAWLADPAYRMWLAEAANGAAPVGIMVVGPAELDVADLSERDLELKRIYLLSRFHGGGVGRQLLHEALNYCRERGAARLLLGVYAKNDAAIGFYQRCGFTKVGTRKFKVGEQYFDDFIMGLPLEK